MSKLEVGLHRTKAEFDFDIEGMAELLEAAYMTDNRVQTNKWKRKSYPPSGVGYGSGKCPRRWYYEFQGSFVRIDDKDAMSIANMKYGVEAHERIQGLFEKADILIEMEKEINTIGSDELPPFKGYVDLIVDWNGPTVGEIKTTKQEAFTLLKASGKPHGYQLIQLLIYMKVLGIDKGFFLYENKNTGEMLIMPVNMDEENTKLADDAFDWFKTVFENQELPERPFTKSSTECLYCPFKKACWGDEDGTVELPVLVVP